MEQFAHLSVEQTKQKQDEQDVTVVDIRDEQSFGAGRIPGAIHLSNGNLSQFISDADLDAPVVVCCYHGISSQQAAQYLIHQGFEEVYSMDGGFEAWKVRYPIESGE